MFLFQAEDGIRDYKVTGVQTCALPIADAGARRRLHRVCGAWWRCPGELQRLGRLRMESEGMTEERKVHSITVLGLAFDRAGGSPAHDPDHLGLVRGTGVLRRRLDAAS